MGKEIADLVHEVDAQIRVLDPGMNVHAANHHATGDHAEVLGHDLVTITIGGLLLPPQGKGMGRRGDDGGTVGFEDLVEGATHGSRVPHRRT